MLRSKQATPTGEVLSRKATHYKRAKNAFFIIGFILLALFAVFLTSLILKSKNGGVDNGLGCDIAQAHSIKEFFIIFANIIDKNSIWDVCAHFNLKLLVLGLGITSFISIVLAFVFAKKFVNNLTLSAEQKAKALFALQKYEYKLQMRAKARQLHRAEKLASRK